MRAFIVLINTHTYTHMHTHIYTHTSVCFRCPGICCLLNGSEINLTRRFSSIIVEKYSFIDVKIIYSGKQIFLMVIFRCAIFMNINARVHLSFANVRD